VSEFRKLRKTRLMPKGRFGSVNQHISSRGVCPLALADTPKCAINVAIGGKADMTIALRNIRF
jgi:hypothetical protein